MKAPVLEKQQLRKKIKSQKGHLTGQELGQMSLLAVMKLLSHPRLRAARTVVLYYSLPDEVCTHTLVDSLLMSRKTVLLPRVTGEHTMELRRYTGPASLAVGAYGIMEPTGDTFDDYASIDLVVVPGVAFDRAGHRLGRGKGYYDRMLPLVPQAYKIGLAFDFQIVDRVPTDSHDIKMDEVICQ